MSFPPSMAAADPALIPKKKRRRATPSRPRRTLALDLSTRSRCCWNLDQGRTWFVKEPRLIARTRAIGRSLTRWRFASRLPRRSRSNPVSEDSRAPVSDLLLSPSRPSPRPRALTTRLLSRALYFFVAPRRGLPVNQNGFPSSGPGDRTRSAALLNPPLAPRPPRCPRSARHAKAAWGLPARPHNGIPSWISPRLHSTETAFRFPFRGFPCVPWTPAGFSTLSTRRPAWRRRVLLPFRLQRCSARGARLVVPVAARSSSPTGTTFPRPGHRLAMRTPRSRSVYRGRYLHRGWNSL